MFRERKKNTIIPTMKSMLYCISRHLTVSSEIKSDVATGGGGGGGGVTDRE